MRDPALVQTYLDQALTSPAGRPLPAPPFFVFGTATPLGPTDWDELCVKQGAAIAYLAEQDVTGVPGFAIGASRSWVEPVVFGLNISEHFARVFAADCGLEHFVAVRNDGVEVLTIQGATCAQGTLHIPDKTGVCVMPNEHPGKVCIMRGGPYGSRAIEASADWAHERIRLIAALGCETCEQGRLYGFGREGRVVTGGGPISLVGHPVDTRFTAPVDHVT